MQATQETAKRSPNIHPIHSLIAERWSPYAFSTKAVEPEKLQSLMEAARWAASSSNAQPWSFVFATRQHPQEFEKLLSALVPFNQDWVRNAPVLAFSVARLNFDHNGQPNRHAFHDTGMALANLMTQATALGLYVHGMAGFDVEKAREVLALPEGYEPVAAFVVGYLGDPQELGEMLRDRHQAKRERKPLDAFVYSGKFGQTAEFLSGSKANAQ
ncbi:MAG TPA: nitroreductase family protein [Terriglobia bacterium]|nr:nitroreductase family protein [Terriglobia bacterium]